MFGAMGRVWSIHHECWMDLGLLLARLLLSLLLLFVCHIELTALVVQQTAKAHCASRGW